MKVVHLSHSDLAGGAAKAAYRLHRGLSQLGVDSSMAVETQKSNDQAVHRLQASMKPIHRLARKWRQYRLSVEARTCNTELPMRYETFSDARSRFGAEDYAFLEQADVIHLHWVAGLLDYQKFFGGVGSRRPVVWTLHDMNPFTGGCHYNDGCQRFVNECGACPQLGSGSEDDRSRRNFRYKLLSMSPEIRLELVTPSQWLGDEVRNSRLFSGRAAHVIPNGLNLHDFSPRNQHFAREFLDLPPDRKLLLFVADELSNPRKGIQYLASALERIKDKQKILVVTVGHSDIGYLGGVAVRQLGRFENERQLSLVYSAADLFVAPSVQDNLPNTVLESLACGTPVVGFDVGGMADMIKPGITGMLAKKCDASSLARAIEALLLAEWNGTSLRERCRKFAEDNYSLELQARRYMDLYALLLNKNNCAQNL